MTNRWLYGSMGAIVAAAIIVCGLGGVAMCEIALHPPRRPVLPNPSARTIEMPARDGSLLRAWLFLPAKSNGAAVLILHGISDSRGSEVGFAQMFLDRGYTVLAPDSRAQGESGGEFETYGLREADDVHRWVSWLAYVQHPRNIFGLGESLGGAILIQSLVVEPRFSAIVAECAFSSLDRLARERVAERLPFPQKFGRLLGAPLVWTAFLCARVRYGLDFRAASPEAAIAQSTTPVLLIHGLQDAKTLPAHSEILAAANRRSARLWLVPGAGHTGAFSAAPREFQERVFGFFETYQNLPSGIQLREK
jgi:dipeptidyl aminopeptidase/acylaminoacyl peptidase